MFYLANSNSVTWLSLHFGLSFCIRQLNRQARIPRRILQASSFQPRQHIKYHIISCF